MRAIFLCLPFAIIIISSCSKTKNNDDKEKEILAIIDTSLVSAIDTAGLAAVAQAHYDNNNYSEALNEYSVLINLDPTRGKFYFRRGYCLTQLDRSPEGISDYLKAVDLNYRQADSYLSIGISYLITKDDSSAVTYFRKCLEIDPNSEQAAKFLQVIRDANKDIADENI